MATPPTMTLLDVVRAVSEYTTSDEEVVATVAHLINSGRVLLCGTFAEARIDLSIPGLRCSSSSNHYPMGSLQGVASRRRNELRP